jgi:hypothetical protein
MNRQAERKMYGSIDADQKSKELLSKLDAYISVYLDELVDKFVGCFEQYAEKIAYIQETGEKGAVAFINFSVLRTNILAKKHFLRIDAYGQDWYADRVECAGEYDVDEVYQWLDKFESALESAREKPGSQLTLADVQMRVFEESNHYLVYVSEIIRAGMKKAADTESYRKINRHEVFVVFVGDYQDQSQIVYKEDTTIKDAKVVKRRLQEKEQSVYAYEICDNLNLSEGDYQNISLMFSSFSGCDFSGSNFSKSKLVANNFRNAVFRDTNMEQIQAFDIDFCGAVLENISFQGARLDRLSFAGAKLINVSFEGVLAVAHMDFDQADLIGTRIPEMYEGR